MPLGCQRFSARAGLILHVSELTAPGSEVFPPIGIRYRLQYVETRFTRPVDFRRRSPGFFFPPRRQIIRNPTPPIRLISSHPRLPLSNKAVLSSFVAPNSYRGECTSFFLRGLCLNHRLPFNELLSVQEKKLEPYLAGGESFSCCTPNLSPFPLFLPCPLGSTS